MKKHFILYLMVGWSFAVHAQSIYSFSGSSKGNSSFFSFYSPLVSGNKTFSNSIVNSGPVQLLTDTTVVLDTTILQYDLDSIPSQLVFYNSPCKFYIKSDSLNSLHKTVVGNKYYVTSGTPLGVFQFDRLNLVQYTTNADTLDFEVKFALITSTNDTVKSKKSIHFKIVPAMPFESSTFGVGGQHQLPDPEDRDWRVQTIDSSYTTTSGFNFVDNQHLRTVSYSGVQVVLEKNSSANQLYLYDKATNVDTLNLYAETLIIRDGFTFPGTTINIFAKELRFEDVNGNKAYLCTTPRRDSVATDNAKQGLKAGDIYLHVLNFSSNIGKRFFLNGGDGQTATLNHTIGAGGNGGNMYSSVDVSDYVVQDGGYSGNGAFNPAVTYKGNKGTFAFLNNKADWLSPKFFSIIVNYYKEGFYAGLTDPVTTNLKVYSDILDGYVADSSIYRLDSATVVQLKQISDDINRVFYNISNNLDYFGNPPGWVPMLSFEVSQAAYTKEVNHALNILFLDRLIQNANNSLTKRVEAFKQLRTETQSLVQDNLDEYNNLSFTVIPDIKTQIQNNSDRTDQLKKQLIDLDKELTAKAQHEYDDRQTWKWVGVAGSVLSMIPTPYTQGAGAALGIAVQVAGGNAAKGYAQGQQLTNQIKTVIQPFVSGAIVGDISNLASNIDGGVSTINTDINNMQNLSDAAHIAEESIDLYNQNKGIVDNIYGSVKEVVDLYNNITSVSSDELGSIKGEMMANEPRFGQITAQLTSIQEDQQKLAVQLQTATQQMLTSKSNVYEGLTAISNFNNVVFDASSSIDHKLSVFSSDMRRKAFERLKKYHYYLAKAYEYRTLQAYTGNLNLTNLVLRIDSLINGGKTTLVQADYTALAAVYNEEIQQIAEDMFTYYNSNQPASTIKATYALKREDVVTLNQGKPITLNFVQAGLFPPDEEDVRIVGLKVSRIKTSVDSGTQNGSFNYIDLKLDYPNYSRIKKKGIVYNFNNYNLNTEYPIKWKSRYDLINGSITASQLSGSANSLLWSLLVGTPGSPGSTSEFVLYSRPSAWADIRITKEQTTNGNAIANIDSVYFEVEYDYLPKPSNIVNVELNSNNKWFAPTFNISTTDKFNRKSGLGDVHRAYSLSASNNVTAEAPKAYGRYTFQKWVDRYGNDLVATTGVDTTGGNKIKFSLATDRSFKAQYKFNGAILKIPDTVYLNQTLQYSLNIKNIGAGSLLWNLDSNSSWLRYSGNKTGINDTTFVLTFDQNTDSLNKRIGVLDVSSTETESLHNYIYFVQGKRTDPRNYAFVGTGNWSNPANWSNELIPPPVLANGETITINPIGSTECVVDVDQTITTANTITVFKGKKIRVLKKFNIQPNAHFNLQ